MRLRQLGYCGSYDRVTAFARRWVTSARSCVSYTVPPVQCATAWSHALFGGEMPKNL